MKFLIAGAMLAILCGCSTPQLPIKERWAEGVRNYALVPIYPMREDVFIGDVRIHRLNGDEFSLDSRLLAHIAMGEALTKSEKSRPELAKTSNVPPPGADGTAAWPQPTGPLTQTASGNRLRLAALPKLDLARVTSADLGGGGLAGLWNYVVGGAVSSDQTLVISLSGVETIEIDHPLVLKKFKELWVKIEENENLRQAICAAAVSFDAPDLKDVRVSMVTRVFYARGIEYAYGDNFGAALKASAGEGALSTEHFATDGGNGAHDNAGAPQIDLSKLPTSGVPGISASFARVSRDGLSLKEIYERPLAFGVDVLSVDPSKSKIVVDECSAALVAAEGGASAVADLSSLIVPPAEDAVLTSGSETADEF